MSRKKKRKEKSLMHFFTRKWYMGEYSKAKERRLGAAQAKHRAEIVSALPADLRVLMGINLNDAECKRFERGLAAGLLEIRLRAGESIIGLFDLNLRYENAKLISHNNGLAALLSCSRTEMRAGIGTQRITHIARRAIKTGGTERAQILYDEVDMVGDELFEHRMLLWPYGEVLIQFTGFSMTQTAVASWDEP